MANLSSRLHDLRHWPTTSQRRSRRNAMVACTALAQRNAQLRDVEDFLVRSANPSPRSRARASRHSAQG